MAVGAPLKERHLHSTGAIGGPFESGVVAHCSCYWEPFWKQESYTLQMLLCPVWKQSIYALQLLMGALQKQST